MYKYCVRTLKVEVLCYWLQRAICFIRNFRHFAYCMPSSFTPWTEQYYVSCLPPAWDHCRFMIINTNQSHQIFYWIYRKALIPERVMQRRHLVMIYRFVFKESLQSFNEALTWCPFNLQKENENDLHFSQVTWYSKFVFFLQILKGIGKFYQTVDREHKTNVLYVILTL